MLNFETSSIFVSTYGLRKELLINEDPSPGPEYFFARKSLFAGRRLGEMKISAIVVRERGTLKLPENLRLMYSVLENVQNGFGYMSCSLEACIRLEKNDF